MPRTLMIAAWIVVGAGLLLGFVWWGLALASTGLSFLTSAGGGILLAYFALQVVTGILIAVLARIAERWGFEFTNGMLILAAAVYVLGNLAAYFTPVVAAPFFVVALVASPLVLLSERMIHRPGAESNP